MPTRARRRKARGQSLVEFAIVLPVLALIFAAGADFGRAFTAYIAVNSAAREGAAYGMLSAANAANSGQISQVVAQEAGSLFGSSISGTSVTGTDTTGNTYVQVTATYTFRPLMPIAPKARFVDLDGPLLLARERENGLRYEGSTVYPPLPSLWG